MSEYYMRSKLYNRPAADHGRARPQVLLVPLLEC